MMLMQTDGSCTYKHGICETCEGSYLEYDNDADNDGSCDDDEYLDVQMISI